MAAQHNSIVLPPVHHRSSNGTALFEKSCQHCGAVSYVDKRALGRPCHPCAQKARATHGLSDHPLYRLLKNIQVRCDYPSATNYAYYGGRGITVCEEWRRSPEAFVSWALANGWAPGLDVDRIDADGDYCPENCRFLSHRENSQRTRRISTQPEQVLLVRKELSGGASIKHAAKAAGVTYMVAWHIKNSPDVWSNIND